MCGWIFGTLMSADADKKEDKLKDLTGEDAHAAVKQPHGGVLSATPRMASFRGSQVLVHTKNAAIVMEKAGNL